MILFYICTRNIRNPSVIVFFSIITIGRKYLEKTVRVVLSIAISIYLVKTTLQINNRFELIISDQLNGYRNIRINVLPIQKLSETEVLCRFLKKILNNHYLYLTIKQRTYALLNIHSIDEEQNISYSLATGDKRMRINLYIKFNPAINFRSFNTLSNY